MILIENKNLLWYLNCVLDCRQKLEQEIERHEHEEKSANKEWRMKEEEIHSLRAMVEKQNNELQQLRYGLWAGCGVFFT